MRYVAFFLILCCSVSNAQVFRDKPTLEVNGDAEVKVVPDRVSIQFGVETRNAGLETATAGTDAAVKKIIATNPTCKRTTSVSISHVPTRADRPPSITTPP